MLDALYALLAGLFIGAFFQALKLPVPAPPVFAGVAGILGIMWGAQFWPVLLQAIKNLF